mmetsp:Transcript_33951/g.74499  ORF Transcript_33951/g.74499 Transcript_33951/m.74499 type:complete len:252 (-) Transcript_33951:805-1560(-)
MASCSRRESTSITAAAGAMYGASSHLSAASGSSSICLSNVRKRMPRLVSLSGCSMSSTAMSAPTAMVASRRRALTKLWTTVDALASGWRRRSHTRVKVDGRVPTWRMSAWRSAAFSSATADTFEGSRQQRVSKNACASSSVKSPTHNSFWRSGSSVTAEMELGSHRMTTARATRSSTASILTSLSADAATCGAVPSATSTTSVGSQVLSSPSSGLAARYSRVAVRIKGVSCSSKSAVLEYCPSPAICKTLE